MKQQGLPSVWFITIDLFEMCENTLATAKSLQSCLTLCDPIDSSPPGSAVPGILRQEHWNGLSFPSPENTLSHLKFTLSYQSPK